MDYQLNITINFVNADHIVKCGYAFHTNDEMYALLRKDYGVDTRKLPWVSDHTWVENNGDVIVTYTINVQ